jgi:hypothetical protein
MQTPLTNNETQTSLDWQFQIPGNANRQPFHPPLQPPPRRPEGGGNDDGGGGCSVCHARFPEEGDDVWRPDLRGCGRRSLGEVRNEGETSMGDN